MDTLLFLSNNTHFPLFDTFFSLQHLAAGYKPMGSYPNPNPAGLILPLVILTYPKIGIRNRKKHIP